MTLDQGHDLITGQKQPLAAAFSCLEVDDRAQTCIVTNRQEKIQTEVIPLTPF